MKFIESKDNAGNAIKISYETYGSGKPVVLIHGWPLSKEMWEYQLEPLVDAGCQVVKYDRRGFGKSDKPWDGYDYDTLAADLNALMEELDLRDATLVGFSMGGGEVARYLANYGSSRVSKAVLISSVVPLMAQTDNNPDGVPEDTLSDMLKDVTNDRVGFLDEFGKTFFGVNFIKHPVSQPLLEYYRMLASFASGRSTRECMKAFAYTDFNADAAGIDVPVLIIHGDADKTVPIDVTAEKAAAIIPNNQFIVYEGAPHGLFYTHKDKLNADLIQFIQSGHVTLDREDTVLVPENEGLV